MGLIFNGNGDVIKAVDGSLTVQGLDLGGGTNVNAGLGTFSDLNVTGTLTYEDVKNVDSVGIISARQSIHVGYGVSAAGIITATSYRGDGSQLTGITQVGGATTVGFNDNKPIYFGTDNDYKIYWNNTKMYFEPTSSSTTQQLEIVSNNQMYINSKDSGLFLMSANQNVIDIYGGGGGGIYFKHNGTQKLKLEGGNWTYLNSATVTHAGDVFIPDKIVHSGDTNTAIRFPAADTITAETGGSERMRVTANGGLLLSNGILVEHCKIVSTAWSTTNDISLDDGNVFLNTANLAGTNNTIDITSSNGLNVDLAVGDMTSVTLITAVNATTAFIDHITIAASAVTESWVGGSAPTDGGGSGYDVYTFNIIKKDATPTWVVIANQVKGS